jgi:DNA-directed RNA polymerase subunit H (RpoH/RPB5)
MNDILTSYIHLKEMLIDRKMDTLMLDNISDVELTEMYNTVMFNVNIFEFKVNDKTTVIYYMNNKFKINDLKKFISDGEKKIIVFKEKINNLNMKNIKDVNSNVEIFFIKELLHNISKHVLVPKHEILKDESEIEEMMNKYQLKNKSQLPIILKTDAMARYLDVKPGDIVKITRNSLSAGETVVYRYCI